MNLGLENRGVIVTGGSRGIGRAIAHAFAAEGCHLAICARNVGDLKAAEAELLLHGGKVCAEVCDVSDPGALEGFLECAKSTLGRADVLVNNASGFGMSDDEGGWEAGFAIDVMAAVRASWKVVPWLEEVGGGSIIHISSTSALEAGSPPAYAAVKAALISHSKTLAIDLASRNIRVNCVAPGSIDFPGGIWDGIKQTNPERYEAMRGSIPFGRLGTPEEVAQAVVFLASRAASWITGITLSVDGGQHKGNL